MANETKDKMYAERAIAKLKEGYGDYVFAEFFPNTDALKLVLRGAYIAGGIEALAGSNQETPSASS